MRKQVDSLEKQMMEKDDINNDQRERIAQLDDCLAEKNRECQALFGSVQSMQQAKHWQEQLYNNAYNSFQSCKSRLARYEQEMLDMDNTISHLETHNKGLRAQVEQLEQEKAQLQAAGAQLEEVEGPKGLNQELLDRQTDYQSAVINNDQDDIINADENEDDRQFEPLIQLRDKDDNEFLAEELDHKEIEMQRMDILKKSQNFPFKVICDPNLPEA